MPGRAFPILARRTILAITINGELLIGSTIKKGSASTFRAVNPATCEQFEPAFGAGTVDDVEQACALADEAFDTYRNTSLEARAAFLELAAQNILDLGPQLIERAMRESGLPQARLEGELDAFRDAAAAALQAQAGTTMLTPGIHSAFNSGVEKLGKEEGVSLVARGQCGTTVCAGQAALFETDAANFLANPALEDEIFGASSLIVRCQDIAQFTEVAEHLDGQLTATIFLDENDRDAALALLTTLERKAGRVLVNAYPTGVDVSHAMVHGGPFPATSDSRSTSVGASAIDRFLRPVSYQDLPGWLLPEALHDANPLGLHRIEDGDLVKG